MSLTAVSSVGLSVVSPVGSSESSTSSSSSICLSLSVLFWGLNSVCLSLSVLLHRLDTSKSACSVYSQPSLFPSSGSCSITSSYITKGSPSAECHSRGHRHRPPAGLPKSIHLRYVFRRVWEGYIAKLPGRLIFCRGQIINSPPRQYPLHAIGGWVISEDISLKQQTLCYSHKFTAGLSDAEPERG